MPETERLIGEWLSLSSSPLNLKHPELKYNRLHVGKVFDRGLEPCSTTNKNMNRGIESLVR